MRHHEKGGIEMGDLVHLHCDGCGLERRSDSVGFGMAMIGRELYA